MRFRATHGTDGGYYRHRRSAQKGDSWTTTPCDACTLAHTEHERRRLERAGTPSRIQRRRERCAWCREWAHLQGAICATCRRCGAPEEYRAGWRRQGGILVPVLSLRETG